jgi:formate C-acetyltransferase
MPWLIPDRPPCPPRLREEVREQIRALAELKEMAASYGLDIGRPAQTAHEAVQWVYMAYLGASPACAAASHVTPGCALDKPQRWPSKACCSSLRRAKPTDLPCSNAAGAVKEQDGAAMSLGRVDAFLDVYFDKDIREGRLTEEQAQVRPTAESCPASAARGCFTEGVQRSV